MGKELRRIGAPFRQPEWSALALTEAPDMVVQAHTNFIEAGAEVIITNNYAVVPYHLGDGVFTENGTALVDLSGRLAREAATTGGDGRNVRVAGSMPPLFGSYEPARVDPIRAAPHYATIAAALAPHVDLWIAETLSTISEVHSIMAAIEGAGSQLPIWISFSLPETWSVDSDGNEEITLRSGESIDDIVEAVRSYGDRIEAVLFNCSLPEQTSAAMSLLRSSLNRAGRAEVQTGGYANAFPMVRETEYAANEVIYERREELTADTYADIAGSWIDDGATIVGGCCDMYPEHIAALAKRFG